MTFGKKASRRFLLFLLAVLFLTGTMKPVQAAGTVTITGISTTNAGNVFTTSDTISIPLVFTNTDTTSYTFNATYYVQDWNGLSSNNGSFSITVPANGNATYTITPSLALKGTYTLQLTAASSTLTLTKSIPFSRITPISSSGVGDGIFGANMHGDQDKGDSQTNITLAQKAGVQWIRDTISWSKVETTPGVYTFPSDVENEVNQAVSAGMQVLLVLCYGNSLYTVDNTTTPHVSSQYTAFANYAAAVAQHFGTRVTHYEVWNEWNGGMGNPNRYGSNYYEALLQTTYNAIQNVAPGDKVIGVVNSTVDTGFIGGVLDSGGYNYMNSVSYHPYTDPSPAEVGNPGWYTIPNAVSSVNNTFTSRGYTPKKQWLSEFGWSTVSTDVDEPHQAAYTARAYATGLANSQPTTGISKMFYYDFQNDSNNAADKESNWGLINNWTGVEVPYSAKQAYVSYNTVTTTLQGATYASSSDIDRVRMIKFTRASDKKDIVMMFNLDDASVPASIHGATAANMQAYDMFGNAQSIPTSVSYAPVYLIGPQGSFNPNDVSVSTSYLEGDMTVESGSHSNDSTHLFAEKVSIGNDSMIQSLSIHVKTAAGTMTMGVYADNGGVPGALMASTASFTPVVGWNTVAVSTPTVLPYGTYWLAFQPSDNSEATAFNSASGTFLQANNAYGALPSTFPSSSTMTGTFSIYANFYTPHLINNAVYMLTPVNAQGTYLNANGTTAGSTVSISTQGVWFDSSTNPRKWQAVYAGQGYWKFYPQNAPTLVLNDAGGTAPGTQVQIGNDDGTDATLWSLKLTSDSYYQLEPKNAPGETLDVRGAGTTDGTPVQVYTINGTNAQKWQLQLYSVSYSQPLMNNAIYTIEPLSTSGKNMTAEGVSNGSAVGIYAADISFDHGANQKWIAFNAGNGYWKFYPVSAPNDSLDVSGGGTTPGTPLDIWYDASVNARLFMPTSPVNVYYQIQPQVASGLDMDVKGAGSADGTPVQIYTNNGTAAQKWRFNLVSSYNFYTN